MNVPWPQLLKKLLATGNYDIIFKLFTPKDQTFSGYQEIASWAVS